MFKVYSVEFSVSEESVEHSIREAVGCINNALVELKRLFLFENCTDTAKLGLALYFLTYLGKAFD